MNYFDDYYHSLCGIKDDKPKDDGGLSETFGSMVTSETAVNSDHAALRFFQDIKRNQKKYNEGLTGSKTKKRRKKLSESIPLKKRKKRKPVSETLTCKCGSTLRMPSKNLSVMCECGRVHSAVEGGTRG